jgi:hypothetical protein
LVHPPFRLGYFVQVKVSGRAAVPLPVEIVGRITVATQFEPEVFASGTMRERDVIVCDVVEKVNVLFRQKEGGGDRVDGSISPSFVKETPVLVQSLEIIEVGL